MKLFEELKQRIDDHVEDIWEKDIILKRNEYLKISGTKDTNIYYIVSGSVRICLEREDEEITFRFGYEKNFIGALDSYIADRPSEFCIKAIKKSEVKVIKKSHFEKFLHHKTENFMLWHRILMQGILEQGERELDILTASPIERYNRVFKRSPHLFQIVPGKYIANYLRMTPETYSRLKKS